MSGRGGHQAGHRRHDRRGDRGARGPGPSRLRLPRRPQAGRRAGGLRRPGLAVGGRAASTPGRRRAASPTCCCARAPARWSRSTSATASWRGRCGRTTGCVVHDRTNVRELDPRHRRRARSTWWWATCRSSRCGWCSTPLLAVTRARRRPGPDGEAAVRGGQGPGRQGRGRPRPGAARRGGHRRRRPSRPRGAGEPGR